MTVSFRLKYCDFLMDLMWNCFEKRTGGIRYKVVCFLVVKSHPCWGSLIDLVKFCCSKF